jgi:hypothetical protein
VSVFLLYKKKDLSTGLREPVAWPSSAPTNERTTAQHTRQFFLLIKFFRAEESRRRRVRVIYVQVIYIDVGPSAHCIPFTHGRKSSGTAGAAAAAAAKEKEK